MEVKGNNPAIFLSTMYKEKFSFYYALYHEIVHVKRDYNKGKNKILVNNDDNEKLTDVLALNFMIDPISWELIKDDLSKISKICKEEKIPLCFLYTRMAYEKMIKYNDSEYLSHRESINLSE